MIGAWMIYCLGIALLLGVAAAALERVARLYGQPARLPWVAAIVGSGLFPLGAWLAPRAVEPGAGSGVLIGPITVLTNGAVGVPDSWTPSFAAADPILLYLWIGMSGGLLVYLGLSLLSLARLRRSWSAEHVAGEDVLLTEDVGPCVIGFVRSRIVLPSWVVDAPRFDGRLAFVHEQEHVKGRDPLLLLLATVMLVAMPWNLPLWWQLRRLRAAI